MRSELRTGAAVLVAALALEARAEHFPPNPGFEEADALWSLSGAAELRADAACTGSRGLRVGSSEYDADGSSVTSARLPVAPEQKVALSFSVRSRAACSGAYLWLYDAAGKTVAAPKGVNTACWIAETNNAWSAHSLELTVPAGVAAVAVWVHSSPGVTGTADYDDFALRGIAPDAAATPPPAARRPRAPAANAAPAAPRAKQAIIVLKLDDVKQVRGEVPAAWKRADAALAARDLKAAYGVICETLSDATPQYADWIRSRHDTGRVEFWFHGWSHAAHLTRGVPCNEFAGWSVADMRALVERSQAAALAKLGFAFATFGPTGCGAPGPNLDENALTALRESPGIRVALYPTSMDDMGRRAQANGKFIVLDRVWDVNLESVVGVPDCRRLKAGYAAHPERDYFVLQGHPAMWGEERFAEFLRILDFLTAQNARFLTPSECAAALRR